MLLPYHTYPIFGRYTLHNLQGKMSLPLQFFIFVLNLFKNVEYFYSDGNLDQRNGAV